MLVLQKGKTPVNINYDVWKVTRMVFLFTDLVRNIHSQSKVLTVMENLKYQIFEMSWSGNVMEITQMSKS